jgi:hypothetical protein
MDRLEVSPYLVVRALKEATRKSYPRVDAAVEKWVELAHRLLTARTSDDFANLRNVDQKRMEVGKAFQEAIAAVEITDHRDEPLDKTTRIGEFIAAMEGEIIGVEKARAEQGLAVLKPMPQQVIHAANPIQPTNPAVVRPLEPSATAKEIYQKKPLSKESDALSRTDFPTEKLVPWRKIRALNDPNTQLLVEGENGKVYKIPGGVFISAFLLVALRCIPCHPDFRVLIPSAIHRSPRL